jgi:hypothetical protein
MEDLMKRFVFGIVSIFLTTGLAGASEVSFNSLVCRSYDYYQLGGDRKVLEIAATRNRLGTYRITVARAYEILLANGDFLERERNTETDLPGLTCTQAPLANDPKVVTCATPLIENYLSLARVDRTLVLSAFSMTPGRVVNSTSYEATLFGGKQEDYPAFDPKDCILN